MILKMSNERLLAWLIGFLSIYTYFSQLGIFLSFFSQIRIIIYPIIYLMGLVIYKRYINYKRSFILFCISFYIIFIDYVFFPDGFHYLVQSSFTNGGILLSDLFFFYFISLPAFFVGIHRLDCDVFLKECADIGVVNIVLFLISFSSMAFVYNISFDYMNVAYAVTPWVLFTLGFAKKNNRKLYLILSIIGLTFICVSGCRGAAVCCGLYIALMFVSKMNRVNVKSLITIFVVIIIAAIAVIYLQKIVTFMYNLLLTFGFKSRILELYLGIGFEKGLGHYSDRSAIQIPLIENINILGHGIYGDRIIAGAYAHNVLLEWLIDFGIFIGGILCIWLVSRLVRGIVQIFRTQKNSEKVVLSVVISILSCKYMVSASYLHAPEFWMFLGLLIALTSTYREEKNW